jgi:hypothetical protein
MTSRTYRVKKEARFALLAYLTWDSCLIEKSRRPLLMSFTNSAKRAPFLYVLNRKPETRSGFRYSYPADFNYLRRIG